MAITMNGKTFTTEFDKLWIEGRLLKECHVEGALVYPEKHLPYRKSRTGSFSYDDDAKYVLVGGGGYEPSVYPDGHPPGIHIKASATITVSSDDEFSWGKTAAGPVFKSAKQKVVIEIAASISVNPLPQNTKTIRQYGSSEFYKDEYFPDIAAFNRAFNTSKVIRFSPELIQYQNEAHIRHYLDPSGSEYPSYAYREYDGVQDGMPTFDYNASGSLVSLSIKNGVPLTVRHTAGIDGRTTYDHTEHRFEPLNYTNRSYIYMDSVPPIGSERGGVVVIDVNKTVEGS